MKITSPPKPSNIPSNQPSSNTSNEPVASTSTRPSCDIEEPRPILVRNRRPKQSYLESLGIKVRDFAYEKTTLPPVRTIYSHPTQVQPAVNRPIRRQSTEPDDGTFSQESQASKQLEYAPTEPSLTPAPKRNDAFWNTDIFDTADDGDNVDSQPYTDSREWRIESQLPAVVFDSQESGAIIKTPLVTPHGSLQWDTNENTSNMSVSQLDADSQAVAPAMSTKSPLGSSQPVKHSSSQNAIASSSQHYAMSVPSSPLTPLPSSNQSSLSDVLNHVSTSTFSRKQPLPPSKNRSTTSNHDSRPPKQTTKRYNLRKRPSPVSSAHTKPTKRMKYTHPESPIRQHPVSVKSMQLQKKVNPGSPSSHVFLQTGTTTGRTKGKSKMP